MDNFTDKVLYTSHQHKVTLLIKFIKGIVSIILPISFIAFVLTKDWLIVWSIFIVLSVLVHIYNYFFWKKSYFMITNQKVLLKVRNGLFSKFHMSIYFDNIKDIAYSKNNVLHYMFDYGTFFARSSAGGSGDFMATHLPNIEKIYKYVNYLYLMPKQERRKITEISSADNKTEAKKASKQETIEQEKQKLLNIKGVKEVVLLEDKDRKYIFENEEDRNHGVYACINRKIVFCITHDSDFREADSSIVFKSGNKVIFPAVGFHEVGNDTTVSGSPGLDIHKYLAPKFNNLDENDATVLIGFDIK